MRKVQGLQGHCVGGVTSTPRVFGTRRNPAHIQGHCVGGVTSTPRVFGTRRNPAHMRGATPRVFGLGRSVLDRSAAKSFNGGSGSVQPVSVGQYNSTSSDLFISHLWTAQVIALWVTDGKMYSDYANMQGIVSRNGHNPEDLSPLNIVNGVCTTDLRELLNGGSTSTTFVKGPDGMFGPSAESLIEEFAGTGKIFGVDLPNSSNDTYTSLIGLAMNVNTPKIKAARDKFEAGSPPPSRREPVQTPCSLLDSAARAARADCPPTNSGGGGGGGNKNRPKPPSPPATAAEEIDWVLYGGIAAGIAILAGTGYYLYSQRTS